MGEWSRRDVLRAAGAGAAAFALPACAGPAGNGAAAPPPAPAAPNGAFVDLPTGIRMYYEVLGERGDPFLLLGGTGSDHGLWAHHAPELAKDFRVITPDPRGTGRTTRPSDPTTCTMRLMAGDAAGLLDHLAMGPAHVAGLSLGSAVAMELGAARPDLVESLHLHGAWARSDAWFVEMMEIMEYPARQGDLREFLRLALPCILSRTFLADRAAVEAIFRGFFDENPAPPSKEGVLGHVHADKVHDATPRLPSIRAPALVATGENDIQVRPEYGREVAALIPGSEFVLIPGPTASHCALLEMPDEFFRLTRDFIARRCP
jgi:3-oxoadipate enol-lactonase